MKWISSVIKEFKGYATKDQKKITWKYLVGEPTFPYRMLRAHAVHKATGIDARLCILTAPRAREIGEPCSAPDDEQQTE